jgi:hypothetical protein
MEVEAYGKPPILSCCERIILKSPIQSYGPLKLSPNFIILVQN